MKYLDKLLQGRQVEWLTLGEVAEIKTGQAVSKEMISANPGEYPVINSGKEPLGYINKWNVESNPIGITTRGAGVGSITWQEGKYFRGNLNYSINIYDNRELEIKFLYHLLLYLQFEIQSLCTFQGIPALNATNLKKLQIPIPPMDVQQEIVRILDKFTELTTELTVELSAELKARKKQYAYYREELLMVNGEGLMVNEQTKDNLPFTINNLPLKKVEWKTLGEVALEFGRGKSKHRPRNDAKLYGGDTPFIQTGDIRNAAHVIEQYSQTYSDFGLRQSKLWPKGTLCITIAANIAETSILGFDACFPDSIIGFIANPEITSTNYVEYLLSSMKTKLEEKGQGSAQSNINMGTFENLKLPFPPLAEQERIVSILDKFDTLTNSISEGLPREIELRQKQYEYYRNKLLSF